MSLFINYTVARTYPMVLLATMVTNIIRTFSGTMISHSGTKYKQTLPLILLLIFAGLVTLSPQPQPPSRAVFEASRVPPAFPGIFTFIRSPRRLEQLTRKFFVIQISPVSSSLKIDSSLDIDSSTTIENKKDNHNKHHQTIQGVLDGYSFQKLEHFV